MGPVATRRAQLPAASRREGPPEASFRRLCARGASPARQTRKTCLPGPQDHDKLATLLKNYFSVAIETKEITFKGWNWGDTDFQGQDLAFLVSDRVAFELPLQNVANSNIAGRTEVSLEFSGLTTSKSVRPQGDEMVEIRFHVPGVQTKLKGESASDAGQSDDEEEISAAQVFHDLIKDKAEIGQVSG